MRTIVAWVVVGLLLAGGAGLAGADGSKPPTRLSRDLATLAGAGPAAAGAAAAVPGGIPGAYQEVPLTVVGGWVTIDAVAVADPAVLEADLIALGALDTAIAGRLVSARLPVVAVPMLEGVASLQFARPAHLRTHVGLVTSQGDHVLRADTARATFGLDGAGVTVGVLSDSYSCLPGAAGDIANNDLSPVVVLQEDPGCSSGTDEGRAMLQIVHDIAPGASLAFATAQGGQANFANNIRALRDAGASVIVDDAIYLAEPMFQDGVVAQAVDDVAASGVAYFSAAGNSARKAYEHAFVPGTFLPAGTFGADFDGGTPHNFGGTTMQRITGPGGSSFTLVLQWDSPFLSVGNGSPGTSNDLDAYLLASNGLGGFFVVSFATTNNLGGDPVELLAGACGFPGPCVGFIMIVNHSGANPGRLKYVLYTAGGTPTLSPAISSGTIYGHANAEGAVAVGAANYKTPTTLETFSSGGTTPVLFDPSGTPISDPRQFKPEIVAPDGADTTFFGVDTDGTGFPNFFGTSAAAPHAAGVAALLVQAVPGLAPDDLRMTLRTTAQNMGPAGFDINTGFGLIHADSALNALHVFSITSGPTGTPNPTLPGGSVNLSVSASDSFGHTLTYAWTSTCTGGLPAGGFDNATLTTPTWTAPINTTGASQTCALKVTVSDASRVHQVRHPHGDRALGAAHRLGGASGGPGRRDGRDLGHERGRGQRRDLQRAGDGDADGGDGHHDHGHGAGGGAHRRVQRHDAGGYRGERDDLQGAAEDRRVRAVERGGGERDGGRRHRDQSASGDGRAHGEGRGVCGAAGVDRVEHADAAGVPGAAGGGDGEDRCDDGGWHGAERDGPDGGPAAPGDRVRAGGGRGREPGDHDRHESHRGDGGDVHGAGDGDRDGGDGDVATGRGAGRRADRAGEHHQRYRDGGECDELQGAAEDHGVRAPDGGGRERHGHRRVRDEPAGGDRAADGEDRRVRGAAGVDRVEHAD